MGLRQQDKIQTIMIIEDEEDIMLVYRDFLEKKGYTIEASAPTANEALHDYESYQPDLVIIDYRLPGSMNGLQAAEKIIQKDPAAKILMITAYENVKRELQENPFFSNKQVFFMSKPVQLAHLVRFIASL
ncbi:MAG TPA: response regulator [Nitrososphaera sp.]|jgi:DNA-binding NtrC family response regulator|nr:response regulator [Nitrososphaera sp.]